MRRIKGKGCRGTSCLLFLQWEDYFFLSSVPMMGSFVSSRQGTIVIFNERSAKCHFKAKHSVPPNSQGREGSSCAAGRWCFFLAAVIEETRANHRSHLSQEPIQNLLCASLLLTWHEIVKLSKSSTRLCCVDMGKMKWRAEAIRWISQAENIQPLREKISLSQIIQGDCPCSSIYQDNEFYPTLYFVTIHISLVYEFEWLCDILFHRKL